jgi:hypothetical protein
MNGDDLLTQLAKAKREEDASADDPRWEKLARGELSAAEDAELRARAETEPEVALLYEAYRPLSAQVKERIAARIASAPKSSVVVLRPWRRIAVIVLPLAAAAAFVVAARRPQPELDARSPSYTLEASRGDRAQRSAHETAPGPIALQRDSTLELVLRPSTPSSVPVTVRAFLVQGEDARAWSPPIQRSADGAARIAGKASELGLQSGTWDLAFALGNADAVPSDPSAIARALRAPSSAHRWQLLTTRVTVTEN